MYPSRHWISSPPFPQVSLWPSFYLLLPGFSLVFPRFPSFYLPFFLSPLSAASAASAGIHSAGISCADCSSSPSASNACRCYRGISPTLCRLPYRPSHRTRRRHRRRPHHRRWLLRHPLGPVVPRAVVRLTRAIPGARLSLPLGLPLGPVF